MFLSSLVASLLVVGAVGGAVEFNDEATFKAALAGKSAFVKFYAPW